MKSFNCQSCNNPVYFENTKCEACQSALGYEPESSTMLSMLNDGNSGIFSNQDKNFQLCENEQYAACNWLVAIDEHSSLCQACQLNRTIPNLSLDKNLNEWRNLEQAKHRLIYALKRFGLPIEPKTDTYNGIAFDFLSTDGKIEDDQSFKTGHYNGVITINIKEADNIHREQMKKQMEEPYRTLIGHFRHEIGHYYWIRLIHPNSNYLEDFRNLFGDDRADYSDALKKYYQSNKNDWPNFYISHYASAHPWEDWAETWAHYFHLVDMLDTATSVGLLEASSPKVSDAYSEDNFEHIFKSIVPLSIAINSLNRSMGQPDIYPFVISEIVQKKLAFVHQIIRNSASFSKRIL